MRRILKLNTFGAFDLSASKKAGTDYNAGGVIGVDYSGRIFVLESYMKRQSDPLECFEIMINHIIKYKCIGYVMERNRFEFLMDTIEKLMDSGYFDSKYDMKEFRYAMGIISTPYKNRKEDNKVEEIESVLQPLAKSHSIYLRSDMRKERNQFANYMINDDFLDWLRNAVKISYPPSGQFAEDEGVRNNSINESSRLQKMSLNEMIAQDPPNPWTGLYEIGNLN